MHPCRMVRFMKYDVLVTSRNEEKCAGRILDGMRKQSCNLKISDSNVRELIRHHED